jgi:hypothetical protein
MRGQNFFVKFRKMTSQNALKILLSRRINIFSQTTLPKQFKKEDI